MHIKINDKVIWEEVVDEEYDMGWNIYRFSSGVKPFNFYSIKEAKEILSEIISYYDQYYDRCWKNGWDIASMEKCRKEAGKYHIPIMYMGRLENLYWLDYEFLKDIRWMLTYSGPRRFVWELEKFAFEGV